MMYAVSRHSKNPELGARFISFLLTDPDAVRILGYSRGIPVSRTANAILEKKGGESILGKKAAHMRTIKMELISPYFEHARIQKHLFDVFENVSFGKISDDAAVTLLIDETNRVLKSVM